MKGMIFNIQKFCTSDGPGIRTTVFLKGCPLSCVWCHNPESQSPHRELLVYPHKCVGCGRCVGVTAETEDFTCYHSAKELCGKEASVDEVLDEVMKDKPFYETSGGGMTLSGGEPLYQAEFAEALLAEAKRKGLHTAVETAGLIKTDTLLRLAEHIDLFLFDYKETDPVRHKEYTGVDNRLILENLRALSKAGKSIVLRCPIIPGYNDRDEHYRGIAAMANELSTVTEINIEPYHSLGDGKYEAEGRKATKIETRPDEFYDEVIARIKENTAVPVCRA